MSQNDNPENDDSGSSVVPADSDHNDDDVNGSRLVQAEILLDSLPAEQRVEVISRYYQGPLPPPQWFDGYNQVVPGAAERILSMAEAEQTHRHGWENKALEKSSQYSMRGLNYGLITAFGLIGGGVLAAYWEQQAVAIAFVSAGAIGIIANFIQGRKGKPSGEKKNDSETEDSED